LQRTQGISHPNAGERGIVIVRVVPGLQAERVEEFPSHLVHNIARNIQKRPVPRRITLAHRGHGSGARPSRKTHQDRLRLIITGVT
jgi:hypothetical protein